MRGSVVGPGFALLGVLVAGSGVSRPCAAGETTPADVFGVDVGTPLPVLDPIANASLTCRQFGTPTNALACQGSLMKSARRPVDSTTFWIASQRVTKIFELLHLPDHTYGQCVAAFKQRLSELHAVLRRPPSVPTIESGTAPGMDERQRSTLLTQGRIEMKTVWHFPGRDLSLVLRGDEGQPVLVVGLEAAAIACDAQSVSAMLMDLFPPALAAARARAAEGLATC
jgi:hypothetical protein